MEIVWDSVSTPTVEGYELHTWRGDGLILCRRAEPCDYWAYVIYGPYRTSEERHFPTLNAAQAWIAGYIAPWAVSACERSVRA